MKPNTVELARTSHWIALATACADPSENPKTGDMAQIVLLPRNEKPTAAVKSGEDKHVCFDCPLRNNGCYVVKLFLNGVYNAWLNGNAPQATADYLPNKPVRFGTYGEPVLLGERTVRQIASKAQRWTGYTHQWRRPEYQWAREFFMASVQSSQEREEAKQLGWRTFRVGVGTEKGEVECLNSSRGLTCAECGICNGANGNVKRADVRIAPHGFQANRFTQA